jgi:hypothetical protein
VYTGTRIDKETVMAKDWKQVAKDQKLVIAELKAKLRKQQQIYARLEKAGWSVLEGLADAVENHSQTWALFDASDKALMLYQDETDRLAKRLEAKKS